MSACATAACANTSPDHYLTVEGVRLRYRDEGQGPAVLLVHGWTLDLEMWESPGRGAGATPSAWCASTAAATGCRASAPQRGVMPPTSPPCVAISD